MGVPFPNVLAKMKLDEVKINDRNRLARTLNQEQEKDPSKVIANTNTNTNSNTNTRRPSVPLQKIHWNALPDEKLKKSIWSTFTTDTEIEEEDIQELEKLFCSIPVAAARDGSSSSLSSSLSLLSSKSNSNSNKKKNDNDMKLFSLEGKRAQNIVIGLSQYKSFGSYSIMLSAICSLDNLGGTLTLDHVENLVPLLPTVTELKKVIDMKDSKHPAELFFLLAKDFYPELPRRLNCFIMTQHFENYCAGTETKMRALSLACSEVVSNQNLSRVLQKMLAIGNVMNQGTNKEATGVTLDSLMKMVNTKGVDKKTSILDYVVKNIIDKGEEKVLLVSKDLAVIDDAQRLSSKEIMKEIELIKKNLDGMEDELKKCNEQMLAMESMGPAEFSSPTGRKSKAKQMNSEFHGALSNHLVRFRTVYSTLEKAKEKMLIGVTHVIEYFGEDVNSCDTIKLFSVLQQFRSALHQSKETVTRRERANKGVKK